MEPEPQLTDKQWRLISDLFVDPTPSEQGGRPRIPPRPCVEGILGVLRTGARWRDLPKSFPGYATCWRRFCDWTADGVWEQAWRRLVHRLDQRQRVNFQESFADGTFASEKKGAIA
jgi:transposase